MTAMVYPWHQGLWRSVLSLHAQQRLPHALLLGAPSGTGKLGFARALAAYVLCQQPSVEHACGHCRSCQLWQAGTHPDWQLLTPEVNKDGKLSKVIKIDQVRDVVSFATQTAQMQGYRVVVIDPAHALNESAANALLKTLEEPGARTLFLLLTDQPSGLLPTIRSRCQWLPMTLPSDAQAQSWLADQLASPGLAPTLLTLARGAPMKAMAMVDSAWFQRRGEFVERLLDVAQGRLGGAGAAKAFKALEPVDHALLWQSLLDDAISHQLAPEQALRHADLPGMKALAEQASDALLETLWQAVELRRLLETQVNAELLLENVWLFWARTTRSGGKHVRG